MQSAQLWAMRSTCSRSKVGVVIAADDNRILCTGYNGAPAGLTHCDHTCDCDYELMRQDAIVHGHMFVNPGHRKECESLQSCTVSVHAETNAIAYAARCGISTGDSRMYVTLSPCYRCAQQIINAGINQVIYLNEYRITDGLELLATAGVDVVKYTHGS